MHRILRGLALTLTSVFGVVLVLASLVLSWWAAGQLLAPRAGSRVDAVALPFADLTATGPGSLISANTMPGFALTSDGRKLKSARLVYRSTSGDGGTPTEVSGSVFVPPGTPPPGGWSVVSFGHGTTGIDEPCAPSTSDSLLGLSGVVAGIVAHGFAVVMPDYEGLGAPGVHPYTDARTAGFNMIDAVRALRHTFPNVSTKWAALGHSQGGGAAWAADEWAREYAPDLDLVGAVALSPAADVSKLVDKAQGNTLTPDQKLAYAMVVESLVRRFPGLDRDDYRHGMAARTWDALTACSGPLAQRRPAAASGLGPADLQPSSPASADELRQRLTQWALPQRPLSAPMYVVYGSADTLIDAQWTTDAIARACALGGSVGWELQPGKGHGDIDFGRALVWIVDRLADEPVTSDCR